MKKSLIIVLMLSMVVVSPLVAKSKKAESVEAASEKQTVAAETTEAPASEKETAETDKTEKNAEKKEEVQAKQPDMTAFADWKKVKNKKIDKTFGIIRIRVLPGRGTFNIGVVDDNNKTISVLSNLNEYTTSYFSVCSGKKIYKLQSGADVKTKARALNDKIQIIYSVNNIADVLVEFIPEESKAGEGFDVLRIQTTVTNTGKKASDIAIKNVMDTVLGEADLYHFYTAEGIPVKNETSFRTMANAKYFNSKNSAATCQFMLYGADVTPTDIVALANYATADSSSWEPPMTSYRTFDTVASYNNSAVDILWPAKRLGKGSNVKNVYYLAFGTDTHPAAGPAFIEAKSDKIKNSAAAAGMLAAETEKAAKELKTFDDTRIVYTDVDKPEAVKEKDTEKTTDAAEAPEEEDSSASIPKELLTPEYIQSLLDRIEALKSTDPTLNADELKMLNDELDFILSIMRS